MCKGNQFVHIELIKFEIPAYFQNLFHRPALIGLGASVVFKGKCPHRHLHIERNRGDAAAVGQKLRLALVQVFRRTAAEAMVYEQN